ncbi:MAG: formiminoglutamase [Bdellovibrio sp.]|nr:MAG: formiminoglutamase [Bdellovibrio sp.]
MTMAFFVSIPHSGEKVPATCTWLRGLEEKILMCDVDRFVDRLYEPHLQGVPLVKTEWHRYAVDLNRVPTDIDEQSVEGSHNRAGSHPRGYHWVLTTTEILLMPRPMSHLQHQELTQLIYEPFHAAIQGRYESFREHGEHEVYHLDLHSMPSQGTRQHRDPGEGRADVVVSDCQGKSAKPEFVDLVITSYVRAGFKVGCNWPYFGGRVSEQYGRPNQGQHCVQVELNRALYMDEVQKTLLPDKSAKTSQKLGRALQLIRQGLRDCE